MMDDYWRTVIRKAWERARNPLGLTNVRIATLVAIGVGTFVVGGLAAFIALIQPAISMIVGVVAVLLGLFLWGMLHAQAEMYRALQEEASQQIRGLDATIYELRAKIEAQKRPPPDYEKWRHVPKMNLRTAAQLWSDEQPNMKLVGESKETYEMLRGAILKGELLLELAGPIDSRMESTARAVAAQNPTSETMVTKEALKAFAARHKYDPRFLRGK